MAEVLIGNGMQAELGGVEVQLWMQFFVWLILNPALGGSCYPKCLGYICMYTYMYIKGIILPSFVGILANHYKDPYSTLIFFCVWFSSQLRVDSCASLDVWRKNSGKLHETSQVSGWWYEGNLAKAPVEIDQNNRKNGICDISTGDRILPQCVNDMEDNARRPSTSILSTEFMQDITWHKPDSTLFDCIT